MARYVNMVGGEFNLNGSALASIVANMNPLRAASCIGLVISSWDLASKFEAEYEFLWMGYSFLELSATQILYIFTRYSPFFFHTIHLIVLHLKEKHLPMVPTYICHLWYIFTIIMGDWITGLFLINLMLRVYALYNRDPRVILALVLLLSIKILKIILGWFLFVPSLRFTPTCVPLYERPDRMIVFVLIELITQGIPVYLTFTRSTRIERTIRVASIMALVQYLRRDGVLSWVAVAVFAAGFLAVAICTKNTPSTLPQMTGPLALTLFSSLSCRSILRMHKPTPNQVAEHSSLQRPPSFGLDTHDAAWTAQSAESESERPVQNIAESPANA